MNALTMQQLMLIRRVTSLIELERPSAYHTTTVFPPHTLRYTNLLVLN
jgi:hypothetical protein